MEVRVLAATDRWAAIDKPSGVAVHRTPGADELPLLQRVRDHFGRRVFPVQRLDRATSGVLLFALDADAARALSTSLSSGGFEKRYRALVRGLVPERGCVDSPLIDSRGIARDAVTHFERLATVELPFATGRYPTTRWSYVELRPETGRTHQLRRHLAHLRHPLLGDVNHGDGAHNRALRERFGVARLTLCATSLAFPDPVSGERVRVAAPLAVEIAALLDRLGIARETIR